MKQKYKAGEVAIFHDKRRDWLVEVVDGGTDENGDWWYDVAIDPYTITRTVRQDALEKWDEEDMNYIFAGRF